MDVSNVTLNSQAGKAVVLVALSGVLVFLGCSEDHRPADYEKALPGVYEGSQPGFREVLVLNTNHGFAHEVFVGGRSILVESGKWSYDGNGAIRVEPFTSFFDERTRKVTQLGTNVTASFLYIVSYRGTVDTLSPSVDFEWTLGRTNSVLRRKPR